MTSAHRKTPKTTPPAAESPDDLSLFANAFFEAQRAQWEAWQDWLRSLTAFNRDFWEQCAVRYAGGMPIDG